MTAPHSFPHPSRRAFLKAGAAAAAAWALPQGTTAGAEAADVAVIDTHVHFYDPTRPEGVPWPPKDNDVLYRTTLPGDLKPLVQPLGVGGVIKVEASPLVEDNQWILDLAADEPFIVGCVGNLVLGTPEFRSQLARFAKNPLYLGIRNRGQSMNGLTAGSAYVADLQRMADAGRSLDVLGNGAMLPDVANVAALVPDLRIIVDHVPFDPPADPEARKAADDALEALGGHPNVYAKVSNVLRKRDGQVPTDADSYKPELDRLWKLFGPDRVVYGSNWPVSNLVAPYGDVLAVVRDYLSTYRSAEDAWKYFRENSRQAYQWRERG